jgi:hypothetical protein
MAAQHWREWAMYVHMWSLASATGCQERSVLTLVPAVTHRAKAKRRQEEELTRQFLETEMKLKQQAIDEKEYSCVRGSFSCLLAQLSPAQYICSHTHTHTPQPICCTDYPIEEMYTLDKCYHRFCFEVRGPHTTHHDATRPYSSLTLRPAFVLYMQCLGRFVLVKVQEGQTQNMKCPDPDCKEFMTPAEVPYHEVLHH